MEHAKDDFTEKQRSASEISSSSSSPPPDPAKLGFDAYFEAEEPFFQSFAKTFTVDKDPKVIAAGPADKKSGRNGGQHASGHLHETATWGNDP